MANLKTSDLFVVQRPVNSAADKTDAGLYKVTSAEISQFLNTQDAVFFKGTANFTESTQAPTSPQNHQLQYQHLLQYQSKYRTYYYHQ